mmetsp:Transcript_8452/g.21722  ORF Transcript_8452/g.21722 Transcript_8452/m.21722 type:complete len:101 (-) Transcript_8452:124-426(-)
MEGRACLTSCHVAAIEVQAAAGVRAAAAGGPHQAGVMVPGETPAAEATTGMVDNAAMAVPMLAAARATTREEARCAQVAEALGEAAKARPSGGLCELSRA